MQGGGWSVQGEGCRVEDAGWRMQGGGWSVQGGVLRMQGGGWRMESAGWRVECAGWRMQGGGWSVQGEGCRVEDAGCRSNTQLVTVRIGWRVEDGGWRMEGGYTTHYKEVFLNRNLNRKKNCTKKNNNNNNDDCSREIVCSLFFYSLFWFLDSGSWILESGVSFRADMGFWDTPDDDLVARKVLDMTKLSAVAGLVGSLSIQALATHKTTWDGVWVTASSTATVAAMGAVFALGTCLSAQVRNKPDDPLNHFVGGCAAGTMLGMRVHSYATGVTACAGLGFLAMMGKYGKQEGWRVLPTP
uniref:uncharacterized protein n=2 Tax=Myxine glutinosa TaxID=7769 RepID=UPI00358E75F9